MTEAGGGRALLHGEQGEMGSGSAPAPGRGGRLRGGRAPGARSRPAPSCTARFLRSLSAKVAAAAGKDFPPFDETFSFCSSNFFIFFFLRSVKL